MESYFSGQGKNKYRKKAKGKLDKYLVKIQFTGFVAQGLREREQFKIFVVVNFSWDHAASKELP